jgi:cell division septation protein DedD
MRNSETGEFELVVGNRQLLSGFFIVILLLAVTFAMGYVVGQNSPRTAKLQADASAATTVSTAADRPLPSAVPAIPTGSAPVQPAADISQQPANDSKAAEVNPPAAEPSQPVPSARAAAAGGAGVVAELPPGSFWQVMAVHQPDAEVMVRTLKDMGLPAFMSPAPNNLMRVLVGPYNDTETMGKVKSQLENAGFHPIKK